MICGVINRSHIHVLQLTTEYYTFYLNCITLEVLKLKLGAYSKFVLQVLVHTTSTGIFTILAIDRSYGSTSFIQHAFFSALRSVYG